MKRVLISLMMLVAFVYADGVHYDTGKHMDKKTTKSSPKDTKSLTQTNRPSSELYSKK